MDLIVWFEENDEIDGFQVCYDTSHDPYALTWFKDSGYHHHRIDGMDNCGHKSTPILIADGEFEHLRGAKIFHEKSQDLPRQIAQFVYQKLLAYKNS